MYKPWKDHGPFFFQHNTNTFLNLNRDSGMEQDKTSCREQNFGIPVLYGSIRAAFLNRAWALHSLKDLSTCFQPNSFRIATGKGRIY